MGDFNHPNICQKDKTAEHKQSRRFLECTDDNFVVAIKESTSKVLCYTSYKQGSGGCVKVWCGVGNVGNNMVDLGIPRRENMGNRITTPGLRRED